MDPSGSLFHLILATNKTFCTFGEMSDDLAGYELKEVFGGVSGMREEDREDQGEDGSRKKVVVKLPNLSRVIFSILQSVDTKLIWQWQ